MRMASIMLLVVLSGCATGGVSPFFSAIPEECRRIVVQDAHEVRDGVHEHGTFVCKDGFRVNNGYFVRIWTGLSSKHFPSPVSFEYTMERWADDGGYKTAVVHECKKLDEECWRDAAKLMPPGILCNK